VSIYGLLTTVQTKNNKVTIVITNIPLLTMLVNSNEEIMAMQMMKLKYVGM